MKDKFIIDKEIDLNENDFLNTKIYSDNLTKIIYNTELNKVFTLGLFGKWGTGKSSIIKTSEQDFEDNKKIKFIKYDAWQYINDSFRRMFLLKLREELKYDETAEMQRFYNNESTDLGSKYQLSPTRLAWILGALIILLAILTFIPFDIDYKLPIYSIFTLLGLLITIISGAFHQLKISVTKPHLFAPEQFEDCFKDIISHSLKTVSPIKKKWNWIINNDNSIQNLDKLVIVIDNIDRCSNDVAYNLLTDIKTFLGSEPYSIVFIIPVDDEALKKHIINNNSSSTDNEKEEFLRKFFNVTIRIKPYGETDMYSFAKKICEKSNLIFKPETINIASKEYARNPRRIIQLFNNLLAEMNYYDSEFRSKNETLICCILIAREEYPKYYEKIINSPKILNDEYSDNNKDDNNDKIKRFNRISRTALGSVDISVLNQILTNSHHQFDNIATNIKDAVDTFDSEAIIDIWEVDKSRICDYIIDKLENAIKNKLIETDLVAFFDVCAKINLKYPLERHFTKRIDEKILSNLSILISKTHNYKNLCKYALLRSEQKDNTIKDYILNDCIRVNDQQKEAYWESLYKASINIFSDKYSSLKLSSTFDIYHQDLEIENLSKSQIEYLLSNKFIQDKLSELPKDENEEVSTDSGSKEYQIIKWIFENKKNISQETYSHLFAHIIGKENDETRFNEKEANDITNILKFINPLLNLIPDKFLDKQPSTLYNLIVSNRNIRNPEYTRNRYNTTEYISTNFIDECLENEEHIEEISDYIFNTYRISNNSTDTSAEINKLVQHININNKLLSLIDKKFSLEPIINVIVPNIHLDINKAPENNNNAISILRFCFKQINNNKDFVLSEENANNKLNSLLLYANENSDSNVFSLLEELTNENHYKEILTKIIIGEDSSVINKLPYKLLRVAISSFKKENYPDFSDNFEFLSVIIQNGNNIQKNYVIKTLIDNLTNNTNIEETISTISLMKDIPSFDKSGLLHSHLNDYQQENKDTISEELNNEIDKLKKMAKA